MQGSSVGRRYCSYPLMHGLKSINIRELVRFLIDFFLCFSRVSEKRAMCFYLLYLTSLIAVWHQKGLYSVQISMENHTTFVYQFYVRIKILYRWLATNGHQLSLFQTWIELAFKSSNSFLRLLLPWLSRLCKDAKIANLINFKVV